ncbi:virus tail fiber assembly protein lambda gpK [Pseudomonas baetica]|uniref:Virus tail fiber assembly protein lambda gpK n=1 Tax=Pseudomonas baetica TaxID=674054 RepID=A0ABX4Q3Y1_9PSED|nr:tail fiber assembly protein [Pseudomonas baetica]PKA71497.1 virus tail fiber assembly protein lambda gpK [Pseudomonas baetica]PTC19985.1 phage tail protein [Pseudomonas baetica]
MFNYLMDDAGALVGPVEFFVTPGIGVQLPANAIQLAYELPEAEQGRTWAMANGVPRELIDLRGIVYRKDNGAKQTWSELGALPEDLTADPCPDEFHVWQDNAWVLNEPRRQADFKTKVIAQRDTLLRDAVLRIAPLQYAEDIGDASPDEQLLLLEWKFYSVELNRIEKQAGFPEQITWPIAPGTTVDS